MLNNRFAIAATLAATSTGALAQDNATIMGDYYNIQTTHDSMIIDGNARFVVFEEGAGSTQGDGLGYFTVANVFETIPLEQDNILDRSIYSVGKIQIEAGHNYTFQVMQEPESRNTDFTENVGFNPDTVDDVTFTFNPGDINADGRKDLSDIVMFIDAFNSGAAVIENPIAVPMAPSFIPVDYNSDGVWDSRDLTDFMEDYQRPNYRSAGQLVPR